MKHPRMQSLSWWGRMITLVVTAVASLLLSPSLEAQVYPRWLAIGDSITQHGPKPELQWSGDPRGMASSSLSRDYVHLLLGMMQAANPGNATELKIIGRMGKLGAGTVDQMQSVITELRGWNADLVTVQLGENDHFSDIGAAGFEQRYRSLIDGILAGPKRPRIVCTGVWAPGDSRQTQYPQNNEAFQKDQIISKICQEKGLTFVSVAPIALDPGNHGSGETQGVKWHPNDDGMKGYADALFAGISHPALHAATR